MTDKIYVVTASANKGQNWIICKALYGGILGSDIKKTAQAMLEEEYQDIKMHGKKIPRKYFKLVEYSADNTELLKQIEQLQAENAELKEKAQKLDEQLKAISDRTAKFPSLEQIEKRFLDWAIPFLKARITGCKEEWFGIEWIAKAIWEFIKDGFENAIAVDETNAALRERLEKAYEFPVKYGDKIWVLDGKHLFDRYVWAIEIKSNGVFLSLSEKTMWYDRGIVSLSERGKTWFLDSEKELAEARLAELKGGKE